MAKEWVVAVEFRVMTTDSATSEGVMSLVQPYLDDMRVTGVSIVGAAPVKSSDDNKEGPQ